MANDRNEDREVRDNVAREPETLNESASPVSASPSTPENADRADQADGISSDPADEVPVPIAMSPAEIDERAQAVEAVRENAREIPDADTRAEP